MNRRGFIKGAAGTAALAVGGCASHKAPPDRISELYAAAPAERFPVPAVNIGRIPPRYWRRRVALSSGYPVGSVVVDTERFHLLFIEPQGTAMRYGVSLGKAGFAWSGAGVIQWKAAWPKWTPPSEMIARNRNLAPYSAANGGMPPGLKNPLGARALYIFQNGRDTLYRVHGTPDNNSIGRAVSYGCVRMINQDVMDLYERVRPGAQIFVV